MSPTNTLRGISIPADSSQPIEEVQIPKGGHHIGVFLAKNLDEEHVWIERVSGTRPLNMLMIERTNRYPSVDMWVDEEGLLKNSPYNKRASMFYPGGTIVGDALLLGEDLVYYPDEGFSEPDCADLPESITVESVEETLTLLRVLGGL